MGCSILYQAAFLPSTFPVLHRHSHTMATSDPTEACSRNLQPVTSLYDLVMVEAWNAATNKSRSVTWYFVNADEEVYFGHSSKSSSEITLSEYNSALQRISDQDIYPEALENADLTVAPDSLDAATLFVKRPALKHYEHMGSGVPKAMLDETLVMDQISQRHHPHIVRYYGCRVKRGRITGIVMERLDHTLQQYASTPSFLQLDKAKFFEALQSAVDYLHSLGLAHNDINPDNIMVKEGLPVLIDFGSCRAFGKCLWSLGTPGWCEEMFSTSEKKHDEYSLRKLREWLALDTGKTRQLNNGRGTQGQLPGA